MNVDGRPLLVVGMPVTYTSGEDKEPRLSGLVMYLEVPQTTELGYVEAMVSGIEHATLVALGLAVVLALLAASGVLRPVRALRRATRRMAAGHLDVRLEVTGSDELADLSQSFNESAAELERTVAELRRLEAQGRRFVADVSHELRTPLAAMSAVTDVLDLEGDGETAEALRLISEGTNRLSGLVNDLMEISRFDAGVAALNRDEIDLAESVRRTVASRWPREGEVELRLPEAGMLRARVDPRRLDVVTANLVGNALRHGQPPVRLTLEVRKEGTGMAWAVLRVTDNGPGIAEDALPHIFERFYKASTSRSRSESSGLGLAITAENVRLHGGRIRAANRPRGGAEFTVELPLHDTDTGTGPGPGPGADTDADADAGTAGGTGSGGGPGEGRAPGGAAVRARGRGRAHGLRCSPVRRHRGRRARERHGLPRPRADLDVPHRLPLLPAGRRAGPLPPPDRRRRRPRSRRASAVRGADAGRGRDRHHAAPPAEDGATGDGRRRRTPLRPPPRRNRLAEPSGHAPADLHRAPRGPAVAHRRRPPHREHRRRCRGRVRGNRQPPCERRRLDDDAVGRRVPGRHPLTPVNRLRPDGPHGPVGNRPVRSAGGRAREVVGVLMGTTRKKNTTAPA